MSIRLMNAAWDLPLEPASKLLLLSLADQSNDEGACWPSVATIAKRTGLSERSVRYHFDALEKAGHLTRHERAGRSNWFTVHPRQADTPATVAPLQQLQPTPATVADHPCNPCTHNHQVTTKEPLGRERAARAPSRGTRWKRVQNFPGPWLTWARDETGWSALTVARVADEFQDYWCARTGAAATKADWEATWRNWIRREAKSEASRGSSGRGGRESAVERVRRASSEWARRHGGEPDLDADDGDLRAPLVERDGRVADGAVVDGDWFVVA